MPIAASLSHARRVYPTCAVQIAETRQQPVSRADRVRGHDIEYRPVPTKRVFRPDGIVRSTRTRARSIG